MKIDELKKIEMQIGFTVGILLGALASWVFIMFFTDWQWYFKLFSSIGEVGIAGNLLMAINELIKMRKGLIQAQQMMGQIPNILPQNSSITKTESIIKDKDIPNYVQ